jgi:GR25 family glycosyltransferase involved in LPS biosynthesis
MDYSVIVLENVPSRVKNALRICDRVGKCNWHKAIKADEIPVDEIPKWDYITKRPFTDAHVAIWKSHVSLWEKLASLDLPGDYFHMIFEDDAILNKNFVKRLKQWIETTNDFEGMNMVYFYVFPQQRDNIVKGNIYQTYIGFWGTQCYAIRHSKLKWLLKKIYPMQTSIDEQLARLKRLRSYYIYDDFLVHDKIKSQNRYLKV